VADCLVLTNSSGNVVVTTTTSCACTNVDLERATALTADCTERRRRRRRLVVDAAAAARHWCRETDRWTSSRCVDSWTSCSTTSTDVSCYLRWCFTLPCLTPRAGSGVVRIDPLRFLAGCRKVSVFLLV